MKNEPVVLMVEDELPLRRFVRASLGAHGYRLIEAEKASEVESLVATHNPDIVLLDLGLPDGDGIELTRQLRAWTQVPIIVVSARGREDDKVLALDAGADDYLTKPFGIRELLARMRVAARHASRALGTGDEPVIEVGPIQIDFVRREVKVAGEPRHLTPIEFKILALLARNLGKVLTHRQIQQAVWGPSHTAQSHHVRVHVAELRKKLEAEPARPRVLITEPGVGYRLREPPEQDEA